MLNFISDNMAGIVAVGLFAVMVTAYFVWSAADEREEKRHAELKLIHSTVEHDDRAQNLIVGNKMMDATMNVFFGFGEALLKAATTKPTQPNQ